MTGTQAKATPIRHALTYSLIVATILAVPLQCVIDHSAANIAASCIVMVSSLIVLIYVGWTDAIDKWPLSTFALFGLCVTTQMGALLAQTAAWTPLSESLYDPLYTFGTLAFYQAIALFAHLFYRSFSLQKSTDVRLLRGLLDWAGVYRTPSAGVLWFMGVLGVLTFFFARSEGVGGRIAQAFTFLALAPFLLLFYLHSEGEAYANAKVQRVALMIYALIAVILGLALNTRAIMFSGLVTIALIYLLSWLRSDAPLTGRGLRKLGLIMAVGIALSVPISDIATSMVIARQWRGKVSATQMIRTTYQVWRNPRLIAEYKAEGETASKYRAYDEHYLSNPLLARFIYTKFHDNAFHFARAISTDEAKAELRDISIKLAWVGLPDPVLRLFHVGVDKRQYTASMGDYLAYLGRGIPLGGHKVGSMFAQGILVFGPIFPFVYGFLCLALFALLDLLSVRPIEGAVTVSALAMVDIVFIFGQGLVAEGLHEEVYFVLRNFVQMIVIYTVMFGLARLAVGARKPKTSAPSFRALQHPS